MPSLSSQSPNLFARADRWLKRRWYRSGLLGLIFSILWITVALEGASAHEGEPNRVWATTCFAVGVTGLAMAATVILAMRLPSSVETILLLVCLTLPRGLYWPMDASVLRDVWFPPWMLLGAVVLFALRAVCDHFTGRSRKLAGPGTRVLGQQNVWSMPCSLFLWTVLALIGLANFGQTNDWIFQAVTKIDAPQAAILQILLGGILSAACYLQLVLARDSSPGQSPQLRLLIRLFVAAVGSALVFWIYRHIVRVRLDFGSTAAAVIGSALMQFLGPWFLHHFGWTWRSQSSEIRTDADHRMKHGAIERDSRLVALGGWKTICGLMIAAFLVRCLISWVGSNRWGFVDYVDSVSVFLIWSVAVYLSLMVSIGLVVVILGQGVLVTLIRTWLIWLAVDITAVLVNGFEKKQLLSTELLCLICIPTVAWIHAMLNDRRVRHRWIGPVAPPPKPKVGIIDLMLITLLVGIELTLMKITINKITWTLVVGATSVLIAAIALLFLRRQLGIRTWTGGSIILGLMLLMVLGESVRTIAMLGFVPLSVIGLAMVAFALLFGTLYLIAGWLEQNGWRRFDTTA